MLHNTNALALTVAASGFLAFPMVATYVAESDGKKPTEGRGNTDASKRQSIAAAGA